MTLLSTLEDAFLQVTHRCDWIKSVWTPAFKHSSLSGLTINAQVPTLKTPAWRRSESLNIPCFLCERSAQCLYADVLPQCKGERISLTRNSRSPSSLVPSRYSGGHLRCHFALTVFLT